ncbi:RLA class I histocompatibility antigen, alpha chain 11/11-like isoform X2 [Varanus komodoensis]|uniref:RLA class I histocompatibility antigen, alpha chain 11/11-like isoform X2 n=1 Tax=Varanus komodoensis TaxID=61221 RepID=UPI001CF7887D|nr:RLA class I histocompatibility antigen, alpha chain 11/11-like isoform X2 [Varanus komodoensis]
MMASCEGGLGKPKERNLQFGYDGRDFLSLDMQALTWTAADVEAHRTKRNWLSDPAVTQRFRAYVDQTCAEWFQARLDAGQEGLRRTEPPKVKVTRRAGPGSTETLTCHAQGFYPRRIDVKWSRDKEVWVQESSRGVLAPNSDGTFYFWLGIEIDPAERQHFWCHVEHETLPEPVIKTWEDPTERLRGGCRAAASEKHQDGREAELVLQFSECLSVEAKDLKIAFKQLSALWRLQGCAGVEECNLCLSP